MPLLSFKETDGVQTIGPLAAGTDFQVRDGACLFATSDPGASLDAGFERIAGGDRADWHVGTGKTVYIWTTKRASVFYEALV